MPRRPEDIFTRVARHVDLTAEELRTFLDCGDTCCLIWKGMVKPKARTKKHAPRPHLDKIGSPVRPLFAYTRAVEKLDSLVQLRNACGNNLCINPQHYNPKGVFNLFQYRRGVVPTFCFRGSEVFCGAVMATAILWPSALTEISAIILSALVAAAVAIWAIFSQRAIARRRTTFDHIAMSNADRDLIAGRVTFRELSKKPEGLAYWAHEDREQTEEFQKIAGRLNEFELIAIGIQRGIINYELYARWFKSGAIREWRDAEQFIVALRKRLNNKMIFHEFQEMVGWFKGDSRPPRRTRWWGQLF